MNLDPAGAVVAAEGDGTWSAFCPWGVPAAGEGATVDVAVADLIDAPRDYAADWNDRLRDAPNHRVHWAVVALVGRSDDVQLRDWILGTGRR